MERHFTDKTTDELLTIIAEDATPDHAMAVRAGNEGALDDVLDYAATLDERSERLPRDAAATARALAENLRAAVHELSLRANQSGVNGSS